MILRVYVLINNFVDAKSVLFSVAHSSSLLFSIWCCRKDKLENPLYLQLSLPQNPISKVLSLSILSFSMLTFRLKWLAKQGNLIFLITFITTFVVFSIGLYNFGLLRYYLVNLIKQLKPKNCRIQIETLK